MSTSPPPHTHHKRSPTAPSPPLPPTTSPPRRLPNRLSSTHVKKPTRTTEKTNQRILLHRSPRGQNIAREKKRCFNSSFLPWSQLVEANQTCHNVAHDVPGKIRNERQREPACCSVEQMGELSSRNRLSPIRCKNKCCACLKTFVFFASNIRFLDRRVGAYISSIFPSPTRPPLDLLPLDRPAFFPLSRQISFLLLLGTFSWNCGGYRPWKPKLRAWVSGDNRKKKAHNSPRCQ